jgi:serine/threonine-protein kinase
MRIGAYQVLLELASGGMGKVYLARSLGPGGVERLVAIKRAHEHLLQASKAVSDRFLDEARIAAQVHHSNVIGVHQAGSDGDGYYLVLDYVEGESLEGLIEAATKRGARVPPQVVLTIACDALAGLHAAHEATDAHGRALGVLHRDVSTQNLLVGLDGVTRLTDFGIAKSALSLVVTDEIYVQGKLVYMAPEYLQRKPVDRTLDVYAMGVTLWIALSGDIPWPGAEEAQLLPSILVQGVPSFAASAGNVGTEIAAVVDRACHRDPRQRFQTAREMLDALEEASKAVGGLARHVEVAEYVEGLVGSELALRRAHLKRVRAEPSDSDAPLAAAPPADALEAIEPASSGAPGRPWKAFLYVALVAVAVALVLVALRRAQSPDAGVAPSSAPSAVVPVTSAVPSVTVVPVEPISDVPATSAKARPRPPPHAPRPQSAVPFSTANPYR